MHELTSLGESMLNWFLGMNLWTAVVLGVVAVADRLLARHVSAGWRMCLYAALIARLLLPVDWASPLGVLDVSVGSGATALESVLTAGGASNIVADSAPGLQGARAMPRARPATWFAGVPLVYLAGALLLAWRHCRARLELGRALTRSRPARPAVRALCLRRRVLEHDELGPLATATPRACIVLPSSLIDRVDVATLTAILRHEESHLDRGDPHILTASQSLVAFLWPLLPLWLALRCLRQRMEEACDERVLAGSGDGARGVTAQEYGEALLITADWSPARPARFALPFAGGLERRFQAMTYTKLRARMPQALIVIALVALITGCAGMAPRQSFEQWSHWSHFSKDASKFMEQIEYGDADGSVPDAEDSIHLIRLQVVELDQRRFHRVLDGELPGHVGAAASANSGVLHLTPTEAHSLLHALWRTGRATMLASPSLATNEGRDATMAIGTEINVARGPRDGRPSVVGNFAPERRSRNTEEGDPVRLEGQYWSFRAESQDDGVRLQMGYGVGDLDHPQMLHEGEHVLDSDDVLFLMLPDHGNGRAACMFVTVRPFDR